MKYHFKFLLILLSIFILNSSFCPFQERKSISKKEQFLQLFYENDCSFNGIELKGKVRFVDAFEDIKIRYVNAFPDIKVEFVNAFPDKCGKWQEVNAFEDFKVRIVDSFEDLKVQKVTSFPGMN
ncbi:hypothetical protein [Aureivirga marina]|uniref:hypothetical protein n=1 Tax=Aureivirga marina TaxID=1182451 RepID=UPI0018C947EF|nr:hypothetical protein [Aureivirga marina]